jgi:hypothetical protein
MQRIEMHRGPWGRCWVCGLPTRLVEMNFEAYLHRRCVRIADRAYWMTSLIGAPDFGRPILNYRLYRFLRKVGR